MIDDLNCCGGKHGRRCDLPPLTPAPLHDYLADEIRTQRQMVGDLIVSFAGERRPNEYGPLWPCGVDHATGKPYNLGDLFDHYARTMLCVHEVMQRGT